MTRGRASNTAHAAVAVLASDRGLVVVEGAAGAGKTTTLAAARPLPSRRQSRSWGRKDAVFVVAGPLTVESGRRSTSPHHAARNHIDRKGRSRGEPSSASRPA
jgi:hypothetical protein